MKKLLFIFFLFITSSAYAAFVGTSLPQDYSSTHGAHVSHFGVLKAGPTIPVFKANFPGTSLDSKVWTETTSNSGSVTVSSGYAAINTSTNSSGSAKLSSVEAGRFEAGQVTVFQSGVYAGAGVANNTRIWGLIDSSNDEGLYFKLDGTTFQVCAEKAGSATCVNSGSFSGDTSFAPAASNTTYRIEYSAGRAIFYSASGGKKNLLHEMVNSNEPLVNTLDLGVYYENTNSGNTTDVEMRVRGSSISIWGNDPGIKNEVVVLSNTGITSTEYEVLIDLSDNTNFPHKATRLIEIEHLKVVTELASNSVGELNIGVITRIDGTDSDMSFLFNIPFTNSGVRRILSINNFGENSLKFGVSGGQLTHGITNKRASGVTAVNNGTALNSPWGLSNVVPDVGDVIIRYQHNSGSAWDSLIEAFYHTE